MFLERDLMENACGHFGITLTEEMLVRFNDYARFLVEYNKKLNLTSITEPSEIAIKHFSDSLSLLKFVDIKNGATLADVGTGAGFPSIPLLIVRNDLKLTLFDSMNKRLVFLSELLKILDLKAELVHLRGEQAGRAPKYRDSFDIVTARAVADLPLLCEYCLPLVKQGGFFVPLKGRPSETEISKGKAAAKLLSGDFQVIFEYSLYNNDPRTLILIKKISQTLPKYPRPTSQIVKKSLG